jgi:pyrimidine-nucleoside phosphorylase
MRAVDVISKKRDGGELTKEEIEFFVAGFVRGEIPDYQASAWAMAVLLRGMNARETTDLTLAMVASGDRLNLSQVVPLAIDKHSTGGVGDKTTLVVEPVVAACGVPVGKMTGRGLGFSGGTLDKLESIPGFRADLTTEEFLEQLARIGVVLAGQSAALAPADGKLYALRDVTGTVPSIPLIASSVMSKKIAAGSQAVVLDVKVGVGAFMQTLEQAEQLAKVMVEIGRQAGLKVVALLSDMNQPLGNAVGNALEVKEALATLKGGGPPDFVEHCLVVAAQMLRLAGRASDLAGARSLAQAALSDGSALRKFRALVEAQGGDPRYVDEPERLPAAQLVEEFRAPRAGYLRSIHAAEIGYAAVQLGAGRSKQGDPIDYSVGVIVHRKVGDRVVEGDPLFSVHANDSPRMRSAIERVRAAHQISTHPVDRLPLFYGVIEQT